MPQSTGSIYEIRWHELCPWLVLVKALRASLLIRVLLLAWVGLILTQWGWSVCERTIAEPSAKLLRLDAPENYQNLSYFRRPGSRSLPLLEQDLFVRGKPELFSWLSTQWRLHFQGPLFEGWAWLSSPIVRILRLETTPLQILQLLICSLWAIAVWGITGGAIARITARYLTREEIIGPLVALRAAVSRWPSTAGAPLIALLFAAAMTVPLALLGLLMRLDFLAMVAGLLWGLTLVWGVLLAIVLIALWFGWPLMWATIAVERSDAFDAASRTAAYIYQRPVRLVFYLLIATVLGIFGQLVVSGFAAAGAHLTDWSVSWGSGTERIMGFATAPSDEIQPPLEGSIALATRSIQFWKDLLASVAGAYPLAYLFTSSVGIYLLLRLHVDATEMDEIVVETIEQPREMPELAEHEPEDLSTRRDISLEPADD